MSEFYTHVVQIGPIGKHPNADNLSITHVLGAYPVIIKTGQFQEGDKAVYVSVDAIVPDQPRWTFLDGHRRIKAKRLRGIFSMGLLTEADPAWEVGQSVQTELEITKWEPNLPAHFGGMNEPGPNTPVPISTYDLEGYRRYPNLIKEGEFVSITEKIHGTSSVYIHTGEKLYVKSHRHWRKDDDKNVYWQIARKYNLEEKLIKWPFWALFGEIYGQVQDLKYGTAPGEILFAAFDLLNTNTGEWFNPDYICKELDIPTVPELYRGQWIKNLIPTLAEGKTTIGNASHVREGFVIKPVVERFDPHYGRIALKYVGEGYLTRKEK